MACSSRMPEDKKAAAVKTRWPNDKNSHNFCYYFVTDDGRAKEVLAAGRMREQDLSVDNWIWDDPIRKEFERQLEKMGGAERLLYRTVDKSATLQNEKDMLQFAPSEQEIKDQAAKGKKKGSGKNGAGGGNDGNSGSKGKGKNGGGRIPVWNGGNGGGKGSSERARW